MDANNRQFTVDNWKNITCHPYCLAIPGMSDDEYQALKGDMLGSGQLEPIVLFNHQILDGRHRYQVCIEEDIQPWFKDFDGPDSLLDYVISMNLRRRHLSESQRAMAMANLCQLERGRPKLVEEELNVPIDTLISKTEAADKAGVGTMTMARAISVNKNGSDELIEAVLSGRVAVSAAAQIVKALPDKDDQTEAVKTSSKEPRKIVEAAKNIAANTGDKKNGKEKHQSIVITVDGKTALMDSSESPVFNKTNDNVEWAAWTWNPVSGCLHGCRFCYARAITHNGQMERNYPFKFEPAFYEYRLKAPANTKLPQDLTNPASGRVFVGSMADLFGKWVPDDWIAQVFNACMQSPEWEYLFLTKWPNRYKLLEALPKAWFGASIIQQADVKRVEREMQSFTTTGVKWISLEPMLEPITFEDLSWCDLVVIGAQTATTQPDGYVPAFSPEFDWVVDVVNQCRTAGVPYYLKPNLSISPGMALPKMKPRNNVL